MTQFDRTLGQRMDALAGANKIRTHRAVLKRNIAAGRTDAAPVILMPHPEVLTMRTYDLLLAIPKVGRGKADKTLRQVKVSPSKTLGGLTPRQRAEIVVFIRGIGGGRVSSAI